MKPPRTGTTPVSALRRTRHRPDLANPFFERASAQVAGFRPEMVLPMARVAKEVPAEALRTALEMCDRLRERLDVLQRAQHRPLGVPVTPTFAELGGEGPRHWLVVFETHGPRYAFHDERAKTDAVSNPFTTYGPPTLHFAVLNDAGKPLALASRNPQTQRFEPKQAF